MELKEELLAIITSVGGLKEGQQTQEDDIPIPVPTYGADSDEEEQSTEKKALEEGANLPDIGELVLGEPKDASDVYAGFKDVKDEKNILKLQEFDIIAFRLYDEKFDVMAPVAEE